MAFLVLIKKYECGGVSSKIKEVPSVRSNHNRVFRRFVAHYRYTKSIDEAKRIKNMDKEEVAEYENTWQVLQRKGDYTHSSH